MNALRNILGFELRYQLKSPMFWTLAVVFFLIHLLTIGSTGINIGGDNNLIYLNSAYNINLINASLAYIGMLPMIIFIVTAITRDHDLHTAELIFVNPVSKQQFLLGRFFGGLLLAMGITVSGWCGSIVGVFSPWLEPTRIGPFSWLPYVYSLLVFTLPYTFIVCSFFFTVAALTRSLAWTFATAMAFVVLNFALLVQVDPDVVGWQELIQGWQTVADPSGVLALGTQSRYWTIAEMNSRLPTEYMLWNRLFWLSLAVAALVFTLRRFRLDLAETRSPWLRRVRKPIEQDVPAAQVRAIATSFSFLAQFAQFASQLRRDLVCILQNPFFYVVVVIAAVGTITENGRLVSFFGVPLYPLTSLMLGYFRYGLFPYALLIIIYFSGELVHRDRERQTHELISASPYTDWIIPTAKIVALCGVVSLMLLVSMLTSMALQALSGYSNFEIGLYLTGIFVYNGFYFFMCCVLGVLVQSLSPNKWAGMVILLVGFIVNSSLSEFGFENVLYTFSTPLVVHSDMNGFGPYRPLALSVIFYWGAFCLFLAILARLFYPRGYYAGFRNRLRDAGSRISATVSGGALVAMLAFVGGGSWIFYNTHILNSYETAESRLRLNADYEKKYGAYRYITTPTYQSLTLEADLYPDELRLEYRGSATLANRTSTAISEIPITLNPKLRVNDLRIDGASMEIADAEQGFYLFALVTPLAPGATVNFTMDTSWLNPGFVNSAPNVAIVENGTYIDVRDLGPLPGFNPERVLKRNADRQRFGLEPAPRLPALGDPDYLNVLVAGISSRANVRVIFSTSADQIAVAPGRLRREWQVDERHYFEYAAEQPIWPAIALVSARYAVMRDTWNDVDLAVYYDPKHAYNPARMLETAKKALAYYSREFSPYNIPYFRILEYPRYRSAATAFYGTIPYAESAGFVTNLSELDNADYATMHELAHQWWGHQAAGAYMQGREVLNETLAQYSTWMIWKNYQDPAWIRRILIDAHNGYLASRSRETEAERAVMYTEDQGAISYNKGALVMYVLQDLMGEETINQALRNYLKKFAYQPPPFPTSRDLVNEIRAVSPPEYQELITDLFEKIMLYDMQVDSAEATAIDDGYEITLNYSAHQFEADELGAETEVPVNAWFNVVVFPESEAPLTEQTPLLTEKLQLQSGSHSLRLRVSDKPGRVGIDPWHMMIDRTPGNNIARVHVRDVNS